MMPRIFMVAIRGGEVGLESFGGMDADGELTGTYLQRVLKDICNPYPLPD